MISLLRPQVNFVSSWFRSANSLLIAMMMLTVTLFLVGCGSGENTSTAPPVSPEELAKSIPDEEVINYAKAVIAIEQLRQTTAQEMRQISGDNSFENISCTQPKTINELTPQMQELAINFCTKVRGISEANSLIIPRFNAITVNARNNPDLKKRIDQELISLQK